MQTVKMSSPMKISYCQMKHFLPITRLLFIFTFKAAALLCLSHQVSLTHHAASFFSLHFLHNKHLYAGSSLISVHQPDWKQSTHTCFVKSEKLKEGEWGQKGTFMFLCVSSSQMLTHTQTHTHRQILPLWPLECCAVLQIELKSDFTVTFECCTHATRD